MNVQSATFKDGGAIPQSMVFKGMGCEGDDTSPQLSWSGAPAETKSYGIVMHDPDAPTSGGFYHWVMFNIPGDTTELAAGAGGGKLQAMLHGETLGHTDMGANVYAGPCPPPGPAHRYVLTLYALDCAKLPLDASTTGAKLEFMMKEHTLAKASITGMYARSQ